MYQKLIWPPLIASECYIGHVERATKLQPKTALLKYAARQVHNGLQKDVCANWLTLTIQPLSAQAFSKIFSLNGARESSARRTQPGPPPPQKH